MRTLNISNKLTYLNIKRREEAIYKYIYKDISHSLNRFQGSKDHAQKRKSLYNIIILIADTQTLKFNVGKVVFYKKKEKRNMFVKRLRFFYFPVRNILESRTLFLKLTSIYTHLVCQIICDDEYLKPKSNTIIVFNRKYVMNIIRSNYIVLLVLKLD